jgi:hypothetical protein
MIRLATLSLGLAAALPLLSSPALAQSRAVDACWGAVTQEARGLLSATRVAQVSLVVEERSDIEDQVTGTARADGRPFSFRCMYNHRSGAAFGVSLSRDGGGFGGNFGQPGFGPPPPPLPPQRNPRELAAEACYNPVLAQARRQHPTASNFKIFLSDNRFGQQGPLEIRVNGQGELRQLDRRRERFSYYCTYNARNGRVSDISVMLSR